MHPVAKKMLVLAVLLSACGGPVTVRPDIVCPERDPFAAASPADLGTLARAAERLRDCAPMVRVTFEASIARTP